MSNFEPPFESPDDDPSLEGADGEPIEDTPFDDEMVDRIRGIVRGAMGGVFEETSIDPSKSPEERTEAENQRLIAALERRLEDMGQIGWKDDTPLTELSVYQQGVQSELLVSAANLVANGVDPELAKQLALLDYLIEHPDAFIKPII